MKVSTKRNILQSPEPLQEAPELRPIFRALAARAARRAASEGRAFDAVEFIEQEKRLQGGGL